MCLHETIETPAGAIRLARAQPKDLETVLTVFDAALAGMVAQGNVRQWGTTPFSDLPRMVERFRQHLQDDAVFTAAKDGRMVGVIVVNFTPPPYCWHQTQEQAAYVQPFATVPAVRGQKVGRLLLDQAGRYAVQHGRQRLRLDCFAENPKLPAYYEGAGFTPCGDFCVGDWHGRMYEKILAT